LPPIVDGEGAAFRALNRGKRSALVDLARPEGIAVFERLVTGYDVLFEQFRPGVLERLGMGHERLLARHPRLVVAALTGYGQSGPLCDRAGHDLDYLARAGLLGLQGPSDGKPQVPAFQAADTSGALFAVVAIVSALYERQSTGAGKILDISMLEAVIPSATVALGRLLGGELPARGDEILTGAIAAYDTYLTKDGEAVALGALEPKFLARFCSGAGIEDADMALVPGAHQAELKERFARAFASRTRAQWETFGAEHDCCLEPVLRPDELLADPHLAARGVFFGGKSPGDRPRYFRTPVTPRDTDATECPALGQHTDEILREAGFDDAEVAELRRSNIVR
jgi:crotonobetainyl-CoA:carnitine CoA-transferase CaiB-like acyl-CoA transferase